MDAFSPSTEVMKHSAPYFATMNWRNAFGILIRPLSSTVAGACPINPLTSTCCRFPSYFEKNYHQTPQLSTNIHCRPQSDRYRTMPADGRLPDLLRNSVMRTSAMVLSLLVAVSLNAQTPRV